MKGGRQSLSLCLSLTLYLELSVFIYISMGVQRCVYTYVCLSIYGGVRVPLNRSDILSTGQLERLAFEAQRLLSLLAAERRQKGLHQALAGNFELSAKDRAMQETNDQRKKTYARLYTHRRKRREEKKRRQDRNSIQTPQVKGRKWMSRYRGKKLQKEYTETEEPTRR